jgi:two-component system sensor histidine kinase KdpD
VSRRLFGIVVGLTSLALLVAVMLPFRSQMSVATATLLLIVPSVLAEVVGGFTTGLVAVVASALCLDYFFIPPYGTLSIGTTQNWVGMATYLVVVGLVGVVVRRLARARAGAQRQTTQMAKLFEMTELLLAGRVGDLVTAIVEGVQHALDVAGVTLFVLAEERISVAASVGEALTSREMAQIEARAGAPVSLAGSGQGGLDAVALVAADRPVGLLVLKGATMSPEDRVTLTTFANDAALALEQTQLREQARRAALLEETDRLRKALLGAVSHDLRTPLATITVASSALRQPTEGLSEAEREELLELIEVEAQRLTRQVTNLLDVSRVEAGVLDVHDVVLDLRAVIDDATTALGQTAQARVRNEVPAELYVLADPVLLAAVVTNLLDNALRHSGDDQVVFVRSERNGDRAVVHVDDAGTGVADVDRSRIFDRFVKTDTGGRAGLGLTIARTFVEAHGGELSVDTSPEGGARFTFSLVSATGGGADGDLAGH